MLYVSDANHSRSIIITEYSLCTPKVIILSRNHTDFNMADEHAGPLHMMLYVSDSNHSRSISITEYSLCIPKVIILSRNHTDIFQYGRSACRTAAHDMLHAQLSTCNRHLNPGLSIQSLFWSSSMATALQFM